MSFYRDDYCVTMTHGCGMFYLYDVAVPSQGIQAAIPTTAVSEKSSRPLVGLGGSVNDSGTITVHLWDPGMDGLEIFQSRL